MPLVGLSNQWKTFENLLSEFASLQSKGGPFDVQKKLEKIRTLLIMLNQSPESVIYVGTSHSEMNFSVRDVTRDDGRTQPFAYVDVVMPNKTPREHVYRIRTRQIAGNRPTGDWIEKDIADASVVVDMLLAAIPYAEFPARRNAKCE